MQSVAERRAAEGQTEAPDECRFPCLRPGRAGVEWSAPTTAGRGVGPASGRQAERSGRWSRRHCGGLCGHQLQCDIRRCCVAQRESPKRWIGQGGEWFKSESADLCGHLPSNCGDWSDSAPDASRAVCCANFLSEAISESVNGPHSAEKVAFSCGEAFAAESD